jgi:preprotein translocase subunit SecE
VAKPSRQERRQRRAQQEASAPDTTASRRARQRQAQVRPAQQPAARQQTGRRESAPRGRFVRESWAELKKVEWPGRNQVIQGTVVVIIACAIVGAYLYAADQVFRNLVDRIILRNA